MDTNLQRTIIPIYPNIKKAFYRIILAFELLISASVLQAQVSFIQSSDADFMPGHFDEMVVSGGNISLAGQSTGVNNWLNTTTLPQTLSGHQTSRWNNFVYLSGGFDGLSESNAVYRASVPGSGISAWTTLDTLPIHLQNHAMVTALNYIYILGGLSNGLPVDKIYYAEILADGSLGAWTQSTQSLPQPLWGLRASYHNGYIYVTGGSNVNSPTSALSSVYYTKKEGIGPGLSAFTTAPSLPGERNGHSMVYYGDSLIVIGGYDNTGTRQNTVFGVGLQLDGSLSAWYTGTPLPEAISNHASVSSNGLITVMGGETATGLSDKVYYSNTSNLGSLVWNLSPDLLYEARKNGSAFSGDGQVVLSGGENISGNPIHNTRYSLYSLVNKSTRGSFISYPFMQLGEERTIESLGWSITYNTGLGNYSMYYRLAGTNQIWGNWVDALLVNPVSIGQTAQYLQYMLKFDGSVDDNLTFYDAILNISGYRQLAGNLNSWDTLKAIDSPFWATSDISFTSGNHYIEPGVTILFSPNTGLEIGQANVTFDGQAAQPIILNSYNVDAGLWNGVYFNTSSDNGVSSVMNYVQIQKAGNGTRNANLYCDHTAEPQLNHCSFSDAVGHGLSLVYADLSVDFCDFNANTENGCLVNNSSPSFSNCNFTSNAIAGLKLSDLNFIPSYFNCNITNNFYGIFYPSPNFSFPPLSGVNTYSNTISGIAMMGGNITTDQTWVYNPLGYSITGDVFIGLQNSKARLSIAPGNTILADTGVTIQVGKYIYYNQQYGGELMAVGTADSLITFSSVNGLTGGWDGIYFHYNSDAFGSVSELKNCVIKNGSAYNVKCDDTQQPRIDSCTINNSNGYDLYVMDPNSVPHITNSTTTVFVDGGTQNIDKTWYNFSGGNYELLNTIIIAKINDKARLTIQPGITIMADTGVTLQVGNYIYYNQQYGGELYAEGNTDSLITFTSINGLSGGWDGIYFHYNSDSFGSKSSLKYCTVESGKDFNIKSDGSAEPRIDQCTITNSTGYDIFAAAPNDVQHITNTTSTVFVGTGTQSINKKWYFYGGDYNVVGDIIIAKQNDTVRLTIEPGNTILADTGVSIQVGNYIYYNQQYGGELYAEGNTDSLITFTSINGLSGGWDGIYFHYNSDSFGSKSSLKYCDIQKGSGYNVYCENTVEPRIDNCTVTNSNGYDIYALNPNSVPHVSNTVSTIYVGSGRQDIDRTWYYYGGEYHVIGDIIVGSQNSYVSLNINPGNIIKFDSAVGLQIGLYYYYNNNFGGVLHAQGTSDSLITFTGTDLITNRWRGIRFHSRADNYGGTSVLNYCLVEGSDTNNIYCDGTDSLRMQHLILSNAGQAGLSLNNSSPQISLLQVINNDSIGIKLTGNSSPVIGDTLGLGCDFYGNASYDIENETTNHIFARHNFWQTTDSATIAARIFDFDDNPAKGQVYFMDPAPVSYFTNQSPGEFNLIAPGNYSVTSDQTPDFTWEQPIDPNGDAVSYYFYYTDDSTWTSNITKSPLISGASYTLPTPLTGGQWYWWKVLATDGILSRLGNQHDWRFAVSLPPSTPAPIVPTNGTLVKATDYLVWLESSDPDAGDAVSHYHLQIDDNSDFSSPLIDTTGITTGLKTSSIALAIQDLPGYLNFQNKIYFWRISAVDGFGIEGSFSDGSNYFQFINDLTVKVNLEGPYQASSMQTNLNPLGLIPLTQPFNTAPWYYAKNEHVDAIPNGNIVDWLLLEFRNTTGDAPTATSDKVIYRKAAFLLSDGSVVNIDGISPFQIPVSFQHNVFLIVYHRNHLAIMSSTPLMSNLGILNYDFTTGADKVYGGDGGYKEIATGIWGMACGDANADGSIDDNDGIESWYPNVGLSGYLNADINLDGQADNQDKNDFWLPNYGLVSIIP